MPAPWHILPFAALSAFTMFHFSRVLSKTEVIKGAGKALYTLEDGVKHLVPDWETFTNMGFSVNDIQSRPDAEVQGYPEGDVLGVRKAAEKLPGFNKCPCWTSTSVDTNTDVNFATVPKHSDSQKEYNVCFVDNEATRKLMSSLKLENITIRYHILEEKSVQLYHNNNSLSMIKSKAAAAGCDSIIRIRKDDDPLTFLECPGICKGIPLAELPLSLLVNPIAANISTLLTCTLTLGAALHSHHHNHNHNHGLNGAVPTPTSLLTDQHNLLSVIFRAVGHRRVEECNEKARWPKGQHYPNITVASDGFNSQYRYKSAFPKREVYGLIIFVGSTTRYDVSKAQVQVLREQPHNDSERIVSWIASEYQYACREGSTLCEEVTSTLNYHIDMPTTRLNVAAAPYACAQRRPLRALAHTLLLFEPLVFAMVVDDDTFVNVKMLNFGTPLSDYLSKKTNEHFVFGQLTEGKKITMKGFFYGGAGYVMSKGTIDRLNAHRLIGPVVATDATKGPAQMRNLALLDEVAVLSNKTCPECVRLDDRGLLDFGAKADLEVRLVDLCMNLMAEEKTCYSSDHSLTRCFAHGVYADIVNIRCWGVNLAPNLGLAMCMGLEHCSDCHSPTLTCHYCMANTSDIYGPPLTLASSAQVVVEVI